MDVGGAFVAEAVDDDVAVLEAVAGREGGGDVGIGLKTDGLVAGVADEMGVLVLVVDAQGIYRVAIFHQNRVDDVGLLEGLDCAVEGDAVEVVAQAVFDLLL